ncbi:MAG: 50S ribosomal protein L3 [Candidatus Ancaeobacter aquaticus]|nr:50S ribosomal protein L3 [Candidatus Ancaeobacter aquaticus]
MKIFQMGLLGKKIGMTKLIKDDGRVVPVSVLQVGPCPIIRKKTTEKDFYTALQLGFDEKKKNINKPDAGNFKKSNTTPTKFVEEIRLNNDEEAASFEAGKEIKAIDVFKTGEFVDVSATSIGKGFQGVMKRHNMKGFTESRGTHEVKRHGGSIGCMYPQRVIKGRHMPGQMGNKKVTTQNLVIEDIKEEDNLILLRGAVPGKNGYVVIKKAIKKISAKK